MIKMLFLLTGVAMTLTNIKEGDFWKNNYWLKAVVVAKLFIFDVCGGPGNAFVVSLSNLNM